MFEEKNKATLDRALNELPVYDPPASLWGGIALRLEEAEADNRLKDTLGHLPEYAPPFQVWEAIERQLSEPAVEKQPDIRKMPLRRQIAMAAAIALLLIAGAGRLLMNRGQVTTVTFRESVETIEMPAAFADWNEDESLIEDLVNSLATHPLLKERPEFHDLKEELDELNEAKSEVEQMMENYGADPQLIKQIGQIERERGEVLKQMVAMN